MEAKPKHLRRNAQHLTPWPNEFDGQHLRAQSRGRGSLSEMRTDGFITCTSGCRSGDGPFGGRLPGGSAASGASARKRDCCLILILHTTRMDHTASHLIWRHRRELDATQCRLRRVVSLAPGLFSNLFLFPPPSMTTFPVPPQDPALAHRQSVGDRHASTTFRVLRRN